MRKKINKILENVEISGISAEGRGIARIEGKVYFVEKTIPGDWVDVSVRRNKSSYAEGSPVRFHRHSPDRSTPPCSHFGTCGGCKWQFVDYPKQLEYKDKQVRDALEKIGKICPAATYPIIGSDHIFHYRNKMEYSFTDRKWLTDDEVASGGTFDRRGLGLHVPENFLGVLDIEKCWLQDPIGDRIRLFVRQKAMEQGYSFFNLKTQEGFLRNLMIRTAASGEILILISFSRPDEEAIHWLLREVATAFPQINALQYVINPKRNDTIYDLEVKTFYGSEYITEQLGPYRFGIRAKSFFQTNTRQGEKLYALTKEYAALQPNERLFDLYTGVGSIAIYMARSCKEVVGIEQIDDAIRDARENARLNGIENCAFETGDVRATLQADFLSRHGQPDVIITDPPRAGMHEDVVDAMLQLSPKRIVYVSCNPATQARDLSRMISDYAVEKSQAVDMFPHTPHVENVVQLIRRN
jgi:23S rRNA (uracil1939-C5)-methyltransferase